MPYSSFLREIRSILALATPLIIGQLGQMLLGVIDTIMVSSLGVTPLATLTFTNSLFYIPMVFGMGIISCISVRTSTARGQKNAESARNVCRNGIFLALSVSVVFCTIALAIIPLFPYLDQPADVIDATPSYYSIVMISLIPCLMGIMLKNHADALERPWPAFWINMSGVALNVLLNWIFIFGKLGLPAMGLVGAGIATLMARIAIVVAMVIWFKKAESLKEWTPKHWFKKPDIEELKAQFKLGLPSGLQTLAEVSAFATAGLLIGHFGKVPMAAHQVALGIAGMAFMIPLGLSMALTVRIGETIGNNQRQRTIVKTGWLLTLTSSCSTAILFITSGSILAAWLVMGDQDPAIISTATTLLFVAGIFQIVDGLQVASAGMLRGLHDTKGPAVIGIVAYWIIGIPTGYYLSHQMGMEARGVWWGLAIGLGIAALFLSFRIWNKVHSPKPVNIP
ncbi:multidrug resistance protein NorM [Rubritalea halochordaticola]|uniref:Multidrug-efflux transporter n=1 Tax=Rubritalea halochordaticola TaxID=714537 RepID=A0ABP9UTY8_9BACT